MDIKVVAFKCLCGASEFKQEKWCVLAIPQPKRIEGDPLVLLEHFKYKYICTKCGEVIV